MGIITSQQRRNPLSGAVVQLRRNDRIKKLYVPEYPSKVRSYGLVELKRI
jgi:hypothetical protein